MFSVRVESRSVVAALGDAATVCYAELTKEITRQAIELEALIKVELSGSQTTQFPAKRTGALRNSISHDIRAERNAIFADVYSSGDVKYARIQEEGGRIDRYGVKAGDYQIMIPPRPYMAPGLEARTPDIIAGMEKAVKEGMLAALR